MRSTIEARRSSGAKANVKFKYLIFGGVVSRRAGFRHIASEINRLAKLCVQARKRHRRGDEAASTTIAEIERLGLLARAAPLMSKSQATSSATQPKTAARGLQQLRRIPLNSIALHTDEVVVEE